jgi:hypothetical protein
MTLVDDHHIDHRVIGLDLVQVKRVFYFDLRTPLSAISPAGLMPCRRRMPQVVPFPAFTTGDVTPDVGRVDQGLWWGGGWSL